LRGGFPNTAGTAICDGGVMIDLSPIRDPGNVSHRSVNIKPALQPI
jgi:hypothetical protein